MIGGLSSSIFYIRTDACVSLSIAENLCQGETSQYGLYISHINGIRADYTLDNGYWWNLIVNGESSMVGASGVTVTAGDVYEFVRTK